MRGSSSGENNEAIANIERLIDYYQFLADSFRWKEWAECFDENATYELPYLSEPLVGRDAIFANSQRKKEVTFVVTQHVITNHNIVIEREGFASGQSNVLFTGVPDLSDSRSAHQFGGRYIWRFVKCDQKEWLISSIRLEVLWRRDA